MPIRIFSSKRYRRDSIRKLTPTPVELDWRKKLLMVGRVGWFKRTIINGRRVFEYQPSYVYRLALKELKEMETRLNNNKKRRK